MKTIYELKADIYDLLKSKKNWFTDELALDYAKSTALRLQEHFNQRTDPPRLRLSQMGPKCPRALWCSVHKPEEAEQLPPWAMIKYAFGHKIEALAIVLAKAAGHDVKGEQDVLYVDGISGHRDCVIDGCIVDVKSSSSYGINKFRDGSIAQDDSFGYLDQLDGYLVGSVNDPLVPVKDRGYILAIDKQLGHIELYEHKLREESIKRRIQEYKKIIERKEPPLCTCGTVPDGKSGNIKLDLKASYNIYKHFCFPHLRTFIYAVGPVYLTKVIRKPDVQEVDRYGNSIYR